MEENTNSAPSAPATSAEPAVTVDALKCGTTRTERDAQRAALAKRAEAVPVGADEHAAFEEWCDSEGFDRQSEVDRNGKQYMLNGTRARWNGWRARAALAQRAGSGEAALNDSDRERLNWCVRMLEGDGAFGLADRLIVRGAIKRVLEPSSAAPAPPPQPDSGRGTHDFDLLKSSLAQKHEELRVAESRIAELEARCAGTAEVGPYHDALVQIRYSDATAHVMREVAGAALTANPLPTENWKDARLTRQYRKLLGEVADTLGLEAPFYYKDIPAHVQAALDRRTMLGYPLLPARRNIGYCDIEYWTWSKDFSAGLPRVEQRVTPELSMSELISLAETTCDEVLPAAATLYCFFASDLLDFHRATLAAQLD